jgi:hypothetical protein
VQFRPESIDNGAAKTVEPHATLSPTHGGAVCAGSVWLTHAGQLNFIFDFVT